jgi:hypothetical protein
MQSPSQKKFRGISGVVIAVLLTVIGIAAVLLFWGMVSGFFTPQPKVIIEKVTITKVGDNRFDVAITVREIGGASTEINEAKIIIDGQENTLTSRTEDTTLSPGQSKTLIYSYSGELQPGKTYYVAVYYTKGDSTERSDLYPVTVR